MRAMKSKRFRPYEPGQSLLLPQNMGDWLPEDHLVFFIRDVVDQLDLSAVLAWPRRSSLTRTYLLSEGIESPQWQSQRSTSVPDGRGLANCGRCRVSLGRVAPRSLRAALDLTGRKDML
jgi:hypothetical protein